MNQKIVDVSTMEKIKIYKENAHRTCSLYFSWDMLFYHTFFVSLYLLVFRLFFTFLFAFIFVQQWHVEKVWGWFPIVAFNSDIDTFTQMNSYAIVVTGVAVLCFFAFQCFAHYQEQRTYKVLAWYFGVLMLLVQYWILIIVNYRIRFSINTDLWIIFVGFIVIATLLLYIWHKYLQVWKCKRFIRKEKKLNCKKKKYENTKKLS